MVTHLFIFFVSLFLVIKGATTATTHAAKLAESFNLSKYTVGFIIVAVISILPETFIALNSAIQGQSSFGLSVLFGSNIADLTLIFAILVFYSNRALKVESKILKNHTTYPFILLVPIFLGFDGYYSRIEGLVLMITGSIFYYVALKESTDATVPLNKKSSVFVITLKLMFSMFLLLLGAHFTVESASLLAQTLKISPALIGMLIVGLGTTMPELFFSIKSVKKRDDSLAIGDILGTVLADCTIVVGILALVNPFFFPQRIIYITGMFMIIAAFTLFYFMKSGKSISKKESYMLLGFWLLFIFVEFFTHID